MPAPSARRTSASELLRSVGLLADGPVVWGRPVRESRPGVFLIELPTPMARPPIDMGAIGDWIRRVPALTLDGQRPTGTQLAARLAGYWIPDQVVLYAGMSTQSIGAKVAAIVKTPLGDRRPFSGANWLKTLSGVDRLRIWWAETDAPEEYLDAILSAFAEAVGRAGAELPGPSLVLPFANLQDALGTRRTHGISGAELPEPAAEVVSASPPGLDWSIDRAGTSRIERSAGRGSAAARANAPRTGSRGIGSPSARTNTPRTAARRPDGPAADREPARSRTPSAAAMPPKPEPTYLSAAGIAALQAELAELVGGRRPEIIARIKAARELGDLSENADYESARREQSFAEGRIRTIEDLLRNAVVIDDLERNHLVSLGSTVVVEVDGDEESYTVVGSAEADPNARRISDGSPIGRALIGHAAGDEVLVRTPRGEVHYRIVSVS